MDKSEMYQGRALRVALDAAGIATVCFDRQGEAINKFDDLTVAELGQATAVIAGRREVRGVLVTSSKEAFIVGADIFEFAARFAQPHASIVAHLRTQNAAFTAFEDLPVPTLAVLNGLALGGGFEMTLTCDARVMSARAQVGLPEVSLGLFPGFGGTVRLPRLVGAGAAIEWISGGKPQNAAQALAVGAVDEVVSPDMLHTAARARLHKLIDSGDWRARRAMRKGAFESDTAAFSRAKSSLARTSSQQPAASSAVVLMERCASLSRDEALPLEHDAFAEIARTPAAAAMIQLFVNDQQIRKRVRAYAKAAQEIRRAAVLGAGIMGGGIGFTSASRGVPVILKDIAPKQLDAGMAEANRLLARQVESKRLTQEQARQVSAAIHPTLEFDGFDSVDIVIEAVVENLEVKRRVLTEVESKTTDRAILASNTSSLSIAALAKGLQRPASFVGMHFFNPVPVMPLVEVIRGPQTSDTAIATTVAYASALGKTPVVVAECPGFLVNRILTPYMLGFLRAVADGADPEQVDRVMEEFGWPMGPAYLQDVIGMDTLQHVLEVICAGYPTRMRLDFPDAVRRFVEHGRLGQKSGAGWYRYASDAQGKRRKEVDSASASVLQGVRPAGAPVMKDEEILARLMLPMILEAVRCLQDRIVATPAEVDMSLVLGLGFPRHVGGPLKYVDRLGADEVIRRCESLSHLGPLYEPNSLLRERAATHSPFYTIGSAS